VTCSLPSQKYCISTSPTDIDTPRDTPRNRGAGAASSCRETSSTHVLTPDNPSHSSSICRSAPPADREATAERFSSLQPAPASRR
jgi:hypothetical protein